MSKRRAHSVSASESSEESASTDEETSVKAKSRGDSDEDDNDVKPTALQMPELLDPELFEDYKGLPLTPASSISKDDEFWIVQCPKNMDVNLLLNKKINFGGHSKLKVKLEDGTKQQFEAQSEEVSESLMTCLFQGATRLQAVQVPVQGKVVITEQVEPPEIEYEMFLGLQTKPDKVPLPQGLKLRHPLFGADYANLISVKKRKSERKRKREKSQAEPEMIIPSPPKKNKRKLAEAEAEECATPPPRKKIKQEVETPVALESSDMDCSSQKRKKRKKSKHRDEEDE